MKILMRKMLKDILGVTVNDYPGKISALVFYAGCNLRCPFCHNPELVLPERITDDELEVEYVINFLKEREEFIDAVTLTGGEPLYDTAIYDHLKRIREGTSLLIKLDTNGSLPESLASALPMVDYVALDVKASPERYLASTGGYMRYKELEESIKTIRERDVDYEFRSTMVPGFINKKHLLQLCQKYRPPRMGLQLFRNDITLSEGFQDVDPYALDYMMETRDALQPYCGEVVLRGI